MNDRNKADVVRLLRDGAESVDDYEALALWELTNASATNDDYPLVRQYHHDRALVYAQLATAAAMDDAATQLRERGRL